MWSPPGITETTLIRSYGLMMSDLKGLITKSTSVTFQHIITPPIPTPFLSQLHLTNGIDFQKWTYAVLWSALPLGQLRKKETN